MTTTPPSVTEPREWRLTDGIISWSFGTVIVVEKQAYLALKAELVTKTIGYDALNNSNRKLAEANARIVEFEDIKKGHLKVQEGLKAELDAMRRDFIYEHGERIKCLEQLADAKAQIEDYRKALEKILNEGNMAAQGHWGATDKMKTIAFETLNKWSGK